jgi:hypothetical protein
MITRQLPIIPVIAAFAFGFLPGCSEPDRVEIEESRPRHTGEKESRLDVSYEDAFPSLGEYRWALPAGWKEEPPQQFRLVNFSFGPNREGECYLSQVQGGMSENIGRWCGQMGQPPLTGEQIAELPVRTLFGRPGRMVDLKGTYTGAMGAAPRPDYRLVGVVVAEGGQTVTVKMTGPAALVESNLDELDTFCSSLRLAPGYPK